MRKISEELIEGMRELTEELESGVAAMKPLGSPHARVQVRVSWHQIIEALADAIDSGRDQEPCPFSMRDAEICEFAASIIRSKLYDHPHEGA